MINLNKIIKNDYCISMFSKLYGILVGIISTAFITRYLGVQLKGDYSYMLQIINISVLVLNLGIYQSYAYYFRQMGKRILPRYLEIIFFQLIIYLLFAILLSFFKSNDLFIILIVLTIPFNIARLQLDNIMTVENVKFKFAINILKKTVQAIMFVLLFYFFNRKLIYPIFVLIFIDILSIVTYLLNRKIYFNPFRIHLKFFKKILGFGYIPMISALLVTFNYSLDIILLKHLGTSYDLGIYAAAAGIINYIWLIPDTFKDVLFSRAARGDSTKSSSLSIKMSLITLFIIYIIFVSFGISIIKILYGSDFVDSYYIIIILLFGAISMIFFKILGVQLIAEGKRKVFIIVLFISVLINTIANYLLIPIYGMYGAAYASVISYSICGIAFLIYFSKYKSIKIKELLVPVKSDYFFLINKLK